MHTIKLKTTSWPTGCQRDIERLDRALFWKVPTHLYRELQRAPIGLFGDGLRPDPAHQTNLGFLLANKASVDVA